MMAPQITARLEQENLSKNGGTCFEETHYFLFYAAVAAWSSSLMSWFIDVLFFMAQVRSSSAGYRHLHNVTSLHENAHRVPE